MKQVLMVTNVASAQDQFNMDNVQLLLELGCGVHIACNFERGNNTSPERVAEFQKELDAMGVAYTQIDFDRHLLHFWNNRRAGQQLRTLVQQKKFDCIHCHTPMGGVYGRKTGTFAGIPVIYTAHGFHFFKGASLKNWLLFYPVEKYYARQTDLLITINTEDFERARRKFHPKRLEKIPGVGLVPERCMPKRSREEIRAELGLLPEDVALISVGELNKNKNHQAILRAMTRIPQKNIHYILCGQGAEDLFLHKVAEGLHLQERVHILGYQKQVADYLNAADIFCFPSQREGLGMAALEAMEVGLPLITSSVHGILDYSVDGKTGFSCHPKDITAFAEAVEKLANDETLRKRMGAYNREVVKAYYLERTHEKMKQIYIEQLQLEEPAEIAVMQ